MNIKLTLPIFLIAFMMGCDTGNEPTINTQTDISSGSANESTINTQTDISSGSTLVTYPKLEEAYSFTMPAAKIECFERADQPLYIFCQSTTNPGSSSGLWIKQGDEILAVDIQAKGHATTMEMDLYEQANSVDVLSIYKSFRTD